MAHAGAPGTRWLTWLAVGIGVLVLATVAAYALNPFGTASGDPRARLLGYVTYRAASDAMAPAVSAGDIVLVDTKAFRAEGPVRWDIVAFSSGRDGRPLVYRVAALPGERVEMRAGVLVIDGQPLPPFPGANETGRPGAMRDVAPRTVPPGHYFLLGDNRDFAMDSRYTGPVPRASLVGRIVKAYR